MTTVIQVGACGGGCNLDVHWLLVMMNDDDLMMMVVVVVVAAAAMAATTTAISRTNDNRWKRSGRQCVCAIILLKVQ